MDERLRKLERLAVQGALNGNKHSTRLAQMFKEALGQ
jgi:hypothetical protein